MFRLPYTYTPLDFISLESGPGSDERSEYLQNRYPSP